MSEGHKNNPLIARLLRALDEKDEEIARLKKGEKKEENPDDEPPVEPLEGKKKKEQNDDTF